MKFLHINLTDYHGNGGTAIAMHRLHLGLMKAGVGSKILCSRRTLDPRRDVEQITRSFPVKASEALIKKATLRLGLDNIHALNTFALKKHPAYREADVLNLHCIHEGFFNYLALPSLTASRPAILTVHDMWAFTGQCHYSFECTRWKSGCGSCPHPVFLPTKRDASRLEWKLKNWAYSGSRVSVVCPSTWMAELAKQSMLGRFPIHHIPNGLDTDIYRPLDGEACRSELHIPAGKRVLMFAAETLSHPRKGMDLLVKALQGLPRSLKAETVVLLVGRAGLNIAQETGIRALDLGYITDDRRMAMAYSAADLFLFPTRADNLPMVLQESLACGTPVVSFRVGGVPDVVRPGVTGYLAEPENVESFRDGITRLLEDETRRGFMSRQCRAVAVREYSAELQARRYVEVYQQAKESVRPSCPATCRATQ